MRWNPTPDIVTFISRDDTHHTDSAEKGLDEIIVSKQRNGSTANIGLAFLEHSRDSSIPQFGLPVRAGGDRESTPRSSVLKIRERRRRTLVRSGPAF